LPSIIVIADDLSGAAELAGLAFAHGLSAEVQRQFDPSSDAQLIALDTDSRHLLPAAAAARVRQLAAEITATQPAWIFKKVDSVLRGNVRAEIEAILATTRQSRALLIPANPSRGRVIRGGRYFIKGVPLEQTSFANDPDHPRRSSDVKQLLGDDGLLPVNTVTAGASLPDTGIIVPDIETTRNLAIYARLVDHNRLLAGAADFFEALLAERCSGPSRPPPHPLRFNPPALLVCGSAAAWLTRRDQCRTDGIPIASVDQLSGQILPSGALFLGIGNSTVATNSPSILLPLAEHAANVVSAMHPNTLLAEGGATAAAISKQMNWTRFSVVASAPAGVGVLRPGADRPAPLFLIKPGSYPWPHEVWQAFCNCQR